MLLEVKNLNKKFGSVSAANNISFKMNENEIIGVIGPNGAGKTTFCNIITGYLKPDSGVILYEGKNITKFNVQEIKNIGIHTVDTHRKNMIRILGLKGKGELMRDDLEKKYKF